MVGVHSSLLVGMMRRMGVFLQQTVLRSVVQQCCTERDYRLFFPALFVGGTDTTMRRIPTVLHVLGKEAHCCNVLHSAGLGGILHG